MFQEEYYETPVVICFLFSIFDLLETTESLESSNSQTIRLNSRIKKKDVSKQKIPLYLRDFLFKTIQVVALEY